MRPHPKHARTNPQSPRAWATSDRSGFVGNQERMLWQYEYAGTGLINKNILVYDWEYDRPQRQLGTIILPPDPVAIRNARPEQYYVDEYGAILPEIPTPWNMVPGTKDGGGFAGQQPGRIGRQPATKGFYLEGLTGEIAQEYGGYANTAYTGSGVVPGPNSPGHGGGGGGGNTYVAPAVHFGGNTILWQNPYSGVDSRYFAWAGWFKIDWIDLTPTMFVFDPAQNFSPSFGDVQADVCDTTGSSIYKIRYPSVSPPLNSSGWQFVIAAFDSQLGVGKMYFDNTAGGTSIPASGFVVGTNGKTLFIGGDSSSNVTGDVADFSVWIGNSNFLVGGDIPASVRSLFRDSNGKPVNPTVAIASLGTPTFMLSGNASTFASNTLGSAGALTLNPSFNSPLTNASTSPSN